MAPRTRQGKRQKAAQVMREFSHGALHSGSGAKVTSPAQAKAIAMSVSGQSTTKRKRAGKRPPDVVVVGRSEGHA